MSRLSVKIYKNVRKGGNKVINSLACLIIQVLFKGDIHLSKSDEATTLKAFVNSQESHERLLKKLHSLKLMKFEQFDTKPVRERVEQLNSKNYANSPHF